MKAGDVFCFNNFTFSDGATAPRKLMIILNTPQTTTESYLVFLTTSVAKNWRPKVPGCHSIKNYYFITAAQDSFDLDTYIVFERLYEIPVDQLLNSCLKDGSYSLFELKQTLWNTIKNCIKSSQDIAQDLLDRIT
jgi:hypothetical protein